MEWSEFAERLGRELAALDSDTILIIREREESRHYVQAMREPDRLYAEAVSNNFLEGPLLLTPADEEVLTEAGWRPPTADWTPANWWTELPRFAEHDDFAELADMMVTALRDVQGLRRPADLVYESFHRHATGHIELADFGIDPADPARLTETRGAAGEPVNESAALAAPPAAAAHPPSGGDLNGPSGGDLNGAAPGLPADAGFEARLADAKRRGDHVGCFDLLLTARLVVLLSDPPGAEQGEGGPAAELATGFATTTIGTGTYLMAYTSPEALDEALAPGERPGRHREAGFGELAAAWPHPRWSLVVNKGLPSEIHMDAATVARLDGMRRTAEQSATVDAVVEVAPAVIPVFRLPHGARLCRLVDDSAAPVAVYDAARTQWAVTDAASLPE